MPSAQPTSGDHEQGPETGFDDQHFQAVLRQIVDDGVELIHCLVEQARKDPVPHPFWGDKAPVDHPTEHIARCYDRFTRSIRRSIALARYLNTAPRHRTPPSAAPTPRPPANDPRPRTPRDLHERPESYERLESNEHPDTPDWDEDATQDRSRPIPEVIAEIRADLATPFAPPLPPAGEGREEGPGFPPLPPSEGRRDGHRHLPLPREEGWGEGSAASAPRPHPQKPPAPA